MFKFQRAPGQPRHPHYDHNRQSNVRRGRRRPGENRRFGPRRVRHRREDATHTKRHDNGRKTHHGHRKHAGTEALINGSRYLDAVERLLVHGAILRCFVPRRRRLDLHGGDGHQSGQILRESL